MRVFTFIGGVTERLKSCVFQWKLQSEFLQLQSADPIERDRIIALMASGEAGSVDAAYNAIFMDKWLAASEAEKLAFVRDHRDDIVALLKSEGLI